jgi:site-specific DNA-methyltransferase (adenine-specific)
MIVLGNALDCYSTWASPTIIVSDGPYGIGGYDGDPQKESYLPELYEPHIIAWSKYSKPYTVLWFWNTELGWATVHPILEKHGWKYQSCNIWNKGINHIAGNCNGKTMRSFPVVTEVCVQYVRNPEFVRIQNMSIQDWLRKEWLRTGMPLNKANKACDVKNAATRKYLTKDHCFYFPPTEIFEKLRNYANKYGDISGRPYFELSKEMAMDGGWSRIWYNWNFKYGITNVWDIPALRNKERIKNGNKSLHLNQKPLVLMKRIIDAVCQPGDIVWEPFGGLVSASVAAIQHNCIPYAAEINEEYYKIACLRLDHLKKDALFFNV